MLVSLDQDLGVRRLEQALPRQNLQQTDGVRVARQCRVGLAPAQDEVLHHKFDINDTSRVLFEVKSGAARAQFTAHALAHIAYLLAQVGLIGAGRQHLCAHLAERLLQ